VIDHVRYFLGVMIIVVVPLGLLYWLIIHLWARSWRMCGPIRTYLAVLPVLAALGVLLFQVRGHLLGADLGTNWSLIGIALVLSCPMTWLELQYWRQISISTLVGLPELSQQRKGNCCGMGSMEWYVIPGISAQASEYLLTFSSSITWECTSSSCR
jgi:hypothetical protein